MGNHSNLPTVQNAWCIPQHRARNTLICKYDSWSNTKDVWPYGTNINIFSNLIDQNKATESVTLGQQLLSDYKANEKSKNLLKRNIDRLTASTIGNQSKLPQVVRNAKGPRDKISRTAFKDEKILKYIAEEEINDVDLFRSIDKLKNCCCRSDSTSNCIKQNFTSLNGSNKKLDFNALCQFVRK